MEPKDPPAPPEPDPPSDEWGLPIAAPWTAADDAELGLTTTEDGDW